MIFIRRTEVEGWTWALCSEHNIGPCVSDKRQPDAPIVYNDFLILCPAHALSGTCTSTEYFGPCSRTVVSMSHTSELPCAHSYPIVH